MAHSRDDRTQSDSEDIWSQICSSLHHSSHVGSLFPKPNCPEVQKEEGRKIGEWEFVRKELKRNGGGGREHIIIPGFWRVRMYRRVCVSLITEQGTT